MKIGMTKNAPKTRIPVLWDDRPNDSPVYSQNVVDQFHFHMIHTKYGKTMGKTMGKPMKSLLSSMKYHIKYWLVVWNHGILNDFPIILGISENPN
jgi:hypothetical protein